MRISSRSDSLGAACHTWPFHAIPSPKEVVRLDSSRGPLAFSHHNPGKRFTPTPSAGQAIAMARTCNRIHTAIFKAAATLAVVVTIGACSGTPHARSITLTFIRHAESLANVDGIINTDIPGPDLTEGGQAQAEQIAQQLGRIKYDGIYASDMVRTQQTAAPLAHKLGMRVEILPGLREVDAGWYNGTPAKNANLTYLLAPADWLKGDLKDAIPGSISGHQFNDQFGAAVQKIYQSGDSKPVAFSHAEAIMYWTLMNVKNPKNSLVISHPLPNISRVVITGNPMTGWTLVSWDGISDFSY
jgi:broad specificity phosphatase PhoE